MFGNVPLPISAPRLFKSFTIFDLMVIICLFLVTAAPTAAQTTPSLRINDISTTEGGDDPTKLWAATFTITLSAPSQQVVEVDASTQEGSATGNVDFGAGSAHLTFQPGQTSSTLTVFIKGDVLVEGTEDFFVNLSNSINATIADGQGVCTIIDDDTLLLLTEPGVQRAAALDSVTFLRDAFPITNTINFSSDQRTRITVLGIGLKLAPGETASAVTATAEDSVGTIRLLNVEYVARVPGQDWLWQVVLKLNDQPTTGDIKVRITVHGVTSNFVLVAVKP